MNGVSRMLFVGCLLSGCLPLNLSVDGGYTKGFGEHARNTTRLSGRIGLLTQPQKPSGLPAGPRYVIDREASCFYGFGASLHTSFNKEVAMFGVGANWFGYCKANNVLRFTADVGIKALELGHSGGFSAGFGRPMAEVGIQFDIGGGFFIEPYGTGGYDIRVGSQKPFGYAGGGLRLRLGELF